MVKVRCTTNLDVKHERWPTELPCRPVVGDVVEALSTMRDSTGCVRRLRLTVVACYFEAEHPDTLRVELHTNHETIREFHDRYKRMGGIASA